jgi:hypothetical protein
MTMSDLLTNPIITGGAATLGIGVVFLVLFATGRLPTPSERSSLKEQINTERVSRKEELAQIRADAQRELDTVRTNLRKDLDLARENALKQVEQERQVFQREIDARDKIIFDLNAYIKQLVTEVFSQQESVQKDVVPPLALLAQQLPGIIYALQELNRKRETNG